MVLKTGRVYTAHQASPRSQPYTAGRKRTHGLPESPRGFVRTEVIESAVGAVWVADEHSKRDRL